MKREGNLLIKLVKIDDSFVESSLNISSSYHMVLKNEEIKLLPEASLTEYSIAAAERLSPRCLSGLLLLLVFHGRIFHLAFWD